MRLRLLPLAFAGLVLATLIPSSGTIDIIGAIFGAKKKLENLTPVTIDKAAQYLQQFGYVPPSALTDSGHGVIDQLKSGANSLLKSAVRKFQEFAGLEPTGVLDVRTRKKMAEPRCGVYDVQAITSGREAAFKWRKPRLTYSILSFSPDLPRRDIDQAIRKAFDTWSAQVPLDFTEVSSGDPSADIKIKFASGNHDDPWPFDGRGGVLAHATMPTSGLLHFDEDENWQVKHAKMVYMDARKIASYSYTDLLPVAIHEIGHVLGLSHSRVEDSIMAPFYQETVDSNGRYVMPTLKSDDIRSIQEIYGPRRGGFRPSSGGGGSSFGGGSSSGGRFGSSGGSGSRFGSSGGWGDEDSDSGWSPRFTTERPTTRKHSTLGGLFGSLWSRWMGGSRRDDADEGWTSGRSRTREREVPSASGSDRDRDSDSGFGSSSGDCPSTIDAYTPGFNNNAYLFVGSKVYEMRGKRVVKVHSLRLLFPSGPIYVDAAIANPRTESILLFQSGSVYAFHGGRSGKFALDGSFPKRVPRDIGFSPTGAVLWIDGHQILLSRSDDFAVYDEYWNQATVVSTLSSHFPGFPRGIRGGFADGSELTLFSASQVYRYDATRKMAVGGATSLRSYLSC